LQNFTAPSGFAAEMLLKSEQKDINFGINNFLEKLLNPGIIILSIALGIVVYNSRFTTRFSSGFFLVLL